ncbi:hypothetical protein K432DRAFT_382648 [Lepidopterella palustris CBS 459.81]|uniref:Zn(2)-C6 fungal-type domain-containing protein n=1 Tax=Lepidopterella palustris CBS 459.81 TaxID=1314670 RepID=A0A8E2JEY7_9PEZI|nr:hypothetical protein K432DRAFT_382648 [Lepidopterella palustris CBS 459.81]
MIGTLKVFKSCDACKARKVRCIGHGYPGPCENCVRRNCECHFSVAKPPQRRSRINPVYGELAQESLSTVFGSKPKEENPSPFRTLSGVPAPSSNPETQKRVYLDAGKVENHGAKSSRHADVHDRHSFSAAARLPELYIDRLLADRQTPQRLKDEKFPFKGNGIFGGDYSGYSLTFFSEGRVLSLSTRLGNNRLNELLEKASTVINSRLKSIDKVAVEPGSSRTGDSEILADKKSASTYITSYFEQVHPLYPFLDRRSFEESASKAQLPQLLASNKSWSALYHSVLALGSQYNNGGGFVPGQSQAWQLFSVALAHFPDLLILPDSLMTLQAITAMAIYALNISCIQIEYALICEGARRAQNLGLNRPRGAIDNVSNRTFWVLYSLEKMASFYSGRSSLFIDSDIGCPIPYTPQATFGDFDWFLAFSRHARLLSRVYTSLFSISVAANPISYYIATIDQLTDELERWRMSIPETFRPGEPFRAHTLPWPLSSTIALRVHFLYYNLVLALCRASLHIGAEGAAEDISKSTRQFESKKLLVKTSRSILELTPYIEVESYTPVWLLAGVPLAALFVLFDVVIHNPMHPETSSNLALLDVASGHFSRVEYASGGSLPASLVSEFAHIARSYVHDVHHRGGEKEHPRRWPSSTTGRPDLSDVGAVVSASVSMNEVHAEQVSPPTDALFFPMSDDPCYMPEGFLMGTNVMDLFGSVVPGIDPSFGLNEVPESWTQGLSSFNS